MLEQKHEGCLNHATHVKRQSIRYLDILNGMKYITKTKSKCFIHTRVIGSRSFNGPVTLGRIDLTYKKRMLLSAKYVRVRRCSLQMGNSVQM